MADTEYPQRWLKEHKAVASPEGWRRPTTQELLKCQKGLEAVDPAPELKTVSTSGVPTTATLTDGAATFNVNYSFTDAEYVPTSVTLTATTDGAATVTSEAMDGVNGFIVNVTGGTAEEKITVKVNVDTKSSTNRTVTLKSA